jgi:hypothetical protein
MKTIVRKKEIKYMFIGFFIIFATDSFIVFSNENNTIMRVFQFIIIISIGLMFLHSMRIHSTIDRSIIGLVIVCACLFLGMIMTEDFTGGYFLKIILFVFGYCFSKYVSIDTFVNLYIKCMKYIAAFSLIAYLFKDLIVKIPFIPIVSNGLVDVYFVGLTNINVGNSFDIVRNWGPFWEPGVFQIYLIVALMLVLFYNKKVDNGKVLLFSITILTTFSTSGYISLAILYIAYVISSNTGKKPIKIVIVIGIIITFSIIYFTPDFYQLLFGKFDKNSSSSISFISRWYSILGNISVFSKSPIYGVGPNNANIYLNEYLISKWVFSDISNTNAILMNYSMFGAVVGTYYIFKMYLFVNIFNVKWVTKGLLYLVLLICLSTEPLVYSLLFHILIFYGYKGNKDSKQLFRLAH